MVGGESIGLASHRSGYAPDIKQKTFLMPDKWVVGCWLLVVGVQPTLIIQEEAGLNHGFRGLPNNNHQPFYHF